MRSSRPSDLALAAVLLLVPLAALPRVCQADLPDSLVAYWNFDGSGEAAYEATAGGPGFNATHPNGATPDAPGRFGSSIFFTRASHQFLDVDAPVIAQGQDHTYSAWYRLTEADIDGTNRYFVLETRDSTYTTAFPASYGLRDITDVDYGQFYTQWPDGGTANLLVPGAAGTDWHNIIVTYDVDNAGSEHTVYLDGDSVATVASSDTLMDTAGLIIGSHRAGYDPASIRNWDGWIDDVAFCNRVLTADEIRDQGGPVLGFTDIGTLSPGLVPSVAWGDYDNDGDLDILLTGWDSGPTRRWPRCTATRFQRPTRLLPPREPLRLPHRYYGHLTGPASSPDPASVFPTTSGERPPGHRRLPHGRPQQRLPPGGGTGNVNGNTAWTLHDLPPGTIFIGVRAVNTCLCRVRVRNAGGSGGGARVRSPRGVCPGGKLATPFRSATTDHELPEAMKAGLDVGEPCEVRVVKRLDAADLGPGAVR